MPSLKYMEMKSEEASDDGHRWYEIIRWKDGTGDVMIEALAGEAMFDIYKDYFFAPFS